MNNQSIKNTDSPIIVFCELTFGLFCCIPVDGMIYFLTNLIRFEVYFNGKIERIEEANDRKCHSFRVRCSSTIGD